MLRVVVALAALAFVHDAEAGKRRGKGGKRGRVVRVERSSQGQQGTIRVCNLSGNLNGNCYGKPPSVGDTGIVLDGSAMYGEARITSVMPQPDSCGNITYYAIMIESSNTAVASLSYSAWFVVDYAPGDRARVLPLSGQVPVSSRAGEMMYVTVDGDGDADPDLYVTAYTCDANANVVPYGQGHNGYCMGYYLRGKSDWSLLRTDVVKSC